MSCVEQFDEATRGASFLHFVWGRLFHVNLMLRNTRDAMQFVNLLRLTATDVPKVAEAGHHCSTADVRSRCSCSTTRTPALLMLLTTRSLTSHWARSTKPRRRPWRTSTRTSVSPKRTLPRCRWLSARRPSPPSKPVRFNAKHYNIHKKAELSICYDRHRKCGAWARAGLCDDRGNMGYMSGYCRLSCGLCTLEYNNYCFDHDHRCDEFARTGKCKSEPDSVPVSCPRSCHLCSLEHSAGLIAFHLRLQRPA